MDSRRTRAAARSSHKREDNRRMVRDSRSAGTATPADLLNRGGLEIWLIDLEVTSWVAMAGTELPQTAPAITAALNRMQRITSLLNSGVVGLAQL